MIISNEINPEKQLYYLASLILNEFKNKETLELDFFKLYSELKIKNNISMNLFAFSLDWLFILGAIEINKEKIIKCS